MITPEQIQSYRQKYNINPIDAPTPMKEQGSIGKAFSGSIDYAKQGYSQAKNAKNLLDLLRGGTKLASGAIGAVFSPLAPITEPTIGKGIEVASENISDIPAVQKFSQTRVGQEVAKGAEDIANLSNIAGVVGGIKVAPKAGVSIAETAKPIVGGTGRVLKQTGEGAYGITVPPSEGTARALQTYKESTPNLATRMKNTIIGDIEGKPTTEANTAARYGLIGTEQEIGVQSGRYMKKIWEEKVQPSLKNAKGKLEMNKFWDVLEKKIVKENPELNRRNALLEGLDDLKSGYKNVSKVGLEKVQEYKEGWTKFQSEQVWKGKPIASSTKEVMKLAGDTARDFIYKNTPAETKLDYIDYGNLKSIREAGIKSGVGDLAKKSISRGAWQFVMDKAVTPVATALGKVLYRTGEGLEFIGDSGAKTVGDIVGETKTSPKMPSKSQIQTPQQ